MMGEINPQLVKPIIRKEKNALQNELILDLLSARTELETATQNFNFADSDDMVDLYSYRIIEAQIRYNMFLKKAKEEGLSHPDFLNENVKIVRK